jgi:hypothetical protein
MRNADLVIELEQLKSRVLNLYANSAPSRIDTVPAVLVSDGAGQSSLPAQRPSASRSLPVHWRFPALTSTPSALGIVPIFKVSVLPRVVNRCSGC